SPREGAGEDPAHPAIHPTGYIPRKLGDGEAVLYELIVRRYLASFYPSARVEEVVYTMKEPGAGVLFKLVGRRVLSQEWLKVYHYRKIASVEVPTLRVGEELEISSVRSLKLYTRQPQLHSKASILKWMESSGIGTESTRAQIIETLFKRKYVRGKSIAVTNLGLRVARILSALFKEITEVELTREFERKLREVALGRVSRKEVVDEAIAKLGSKLEEVKKALSNSRGSELKVKFGLSIGSRCSVCGGDAVGREGGLHLCSLHLAAYQNLVKTYETWASRTNASFDDYSATLLKLSTTGRFVKDVIKYLMKRDR
ncbi:MAG: DNA topoisomerase, partial [Sulfolobales archaeon]|nr:DNA topoisomerase [Sulfolobales archaeon]